MVSLDRKAIQQRFEYYQLVEKYRKVIKVICPFQRLQCCAVLFSSLKIYEFLSYSPSLTVIIYCIIVTQFMEGERVSGSFLWERGCLKRQKQIFGLKIFQFFFELS